MDIEKQEKSIGLPTLDQVLSRKTLPPICLYNFYIVLRDRLDIEEILDFYLDLENHEQLWRKYVKFMRRSGYLSDSDLSDGYQSIRLVNRLSGSFNGSGSFSFSSQNNSYEFRKQQLLNSAQSLLLNYLIPDAVKDITPLLPHSMAKKLRQELEKPEPRDDPLLFGDVKEYVFHLMETQAYPKFLKYKVWGNITFHQQISRLVIGFISLLVAFTTSISFIFLGYDAWGIRFVTLIPFWIGVLNSLIFLTGIDPIWVILFNQSETTWFKFNSIKQPEVKRILFFRSIWLLCCSSIISIIITVALCVIPPKRL